jgi:hypothetical protein
LIIQNAEKLTQISGTVPTDWICGLWKENALNQLQSEDLRHFLCLSFAPSNENMQYQVDNLFPQQRGY